ncbi:hypothetical protein CIPAW_06G079500 [Carya illinoinensis]|uniref:Uncharacterized protein n=1 Tax=Carya illinoinensis TaxID=32201 RepID=A0A8T1Q9E3_CARIL|nr:hypothetical protein CIPAW_06G079500 [Carya illinoinensis]
MVECSLSRRSKIRTDPSAETEAKILASPQAMSYTSLSWAMSWVSTTPLSTSQMVQVVSMLEVPTRLGSMSFQSKEVSGVQNSEDLLLLRTERGSTEWSRRSQRRRKSPEEARRLGLEGWNMSLVGG